MGGKALILFDLIYFQVRAPSANGDQKIRFEILAKHIDHGKRFKTNNRDLRYVTNALSWAQNI